MANKRNDKYAGLGQPEVEGVEGLFTVSDKPHAEPSAPVPARHVQPVEQPSQAERVKSSVALDPKTIDLLNEIKLIARKKESRFVSFGELLDQAVIDLAKKMGIPVEE